jgi:uncharacterized membrane protein
MNPPRSGAQSSSRKTHLSQIPFWNIPMIYSGATIVLGLVFPHLEYRYLKDFAHGVTVPVATALFSSIASGMAALTGIVFSLAFVMLQFSRAAYSPRLIFWLSRDPVIWHGLGMFTATFVDSTSNYHDYLKLQAAGGTGVDEGVRRGGRWRADRLNG